MSEHDVRSGGCLCGAVTYVATLLTDEVLQCHCENCRRLSGNYVAAVRSATDELVLHDADERFAWFDLDYARYGFCQSCGALLFFQPDEEPGDLSVMVGTLDDASGLQVASVWFAHDAQPHNVLPDVPHHEGNG